MFLHLLLMMMLLLPSSWDTYPEVGKKNMWYFFTPRTRRFPKGNRPSRSAVAGYWKISGASKAIKYENTTVGFKMALAFYEGIAPEGKKTHWLMHEYTIDQPHTNKRNANDMRLDDWVLCRVYKKIRGSDRSQQQDRSDVVDQNLLPNVSEVESSIGDNENLEVGVEIPAAIGVDDIEDLTLNIPTNPISFNDFDIPSSTVAESNLAGGMELVGDNELNPGAVIAFGNYLIQDFENCENLEAWPEISAAVDDNVMSIFNTTTPSESNLEAWPEIPAAVDDNMMSIFNTTTPSESNLEAWMDELLGDNEINLAAGMENPASVSSYENLAMQISGNIEDINFDRLDQMVKDLEDIVTQSSEDSSSITIDWDFQA